MAQGMTTYEPRREYDVEDPGLGSSVRVMMS